MHARLASIVVHLCDFVSIKLAFGILSQRSPDLVDQPQPRYGVSSFRLVKVGGGYWQILLRLWLKTAFGRGTKR